MFSVGIMILGESRTFVVCNKYAGYASSAHAAHNGAALRLLLLSLSAKSVPLLKSVVKLR